MSSGAPQDEVKSSRKWSEGHACRNYEERTWKGPSTTLSQVRKERSSCPGCADPAHVEDIA